MTINNRKKYVKLLQRVGGVIYDKLGAEVGTQNALVTFTDITV